MKLHWALRELSEITASQWGMVTSAQAQMHDVTPMNLSRLAAAGDLIRLTRGVYRLAGAPGDEFEWLRAAWLALDPTRLAYERMQDDLLAAVVSGESATKLLQLGAFRAMQAEFTVPRRRQTQRVDVRIRVRTLEPQDVTIRNGLPVTTPERTLADLVAELQDLTTIADALADTIRHSSLQTERLTELLEPLAARNGYRNGSHFTQELLALVP